MADYLTKRGGVWWFTRDPFDTEFIQNKILAEGALTGLNEEARRVIFLLADTGLRLSEATNLDQGSIVLDAVVPHVQVRPDGRRMKTQQTGICLRGFLSEESRPRPRSNQRTIWPRRSLSENTERLEEENGGAERAGYSSRLGTPLRSL